MPLAASVTRRTFRRAATMLFARSSPTSFYTFAGGVAENSAMVSGHFHPRTIAQDISPYDIRPLVIMPLAAGGIKRYRDPSVCLSHCAAALGHRHAGFLQLSRVRTAGLSADGRGSAASRTAIVGGHIVSSPPGR